VDHHDRIADAVDLLDHGRREVLVDDLVALLEVLDVLVADVGRVGQIPQVVLDEPQQRVGDVVVEAVVGLVAGGHQADLVLTAGLRAHLERLAIAVAQLDQVTLGHRRGDPDRATVRRQARQRRHEPATTARERSVGAERHRPAIGHQQQRRGLKRLRMRLFGHGRRSYPRTTGWSRDRSASAADRA